MRPQSLSKALRLPSLPLPISRQIRPLSSAPLLRRALHRPSSLLPAPALARQSQPWARPARLLSSETDQAASGAPTTNGLDRQVIYERIRAVLTAFDRVKPDSVTIDSAFAQDLGLDSLDIVEVVMAIEEDFSIEIPDAEADEIKSVKQAVDYIAATAAAT